MELEPNLLDWNVNELERELELEDMKRTNVVMGVVDTFGHNGVDYWNGVYTYHWARLWWSLDKFFHGMYWYRT